MGQSQVQKRTGGMANLPLPAPKELYGATHQRGGRLRNGPAAMAAPPPYPAAAQGTLPPMGTAPAGSSAMDPPRTLTSVAAQLDELQSQLVRMVQLGPNQVSSNVLVDRGVISLDRRVALLESAVFHTWLFKATDPYIQTAKAYTRSYQERVNATRGQGVDHGPPNNHVMLGLMQCYIADPHVGEDNRAYMKTLLLDTVGTDGEVDVKKIRNIQRLITHAQVTVNKDKGWLQIGFRKHMHVLESAMNTNWERMAYYQFETRGNTPAMQALKKDLIRTGDWGTNAQA